MDEEDDESAEARPPGVAKASGGADGGEGGLLNPKRMSREHRTALAKLPDVLDWLVNALEG